jgi:amino acid adenylation domain-containing protein
LLKERLQKAASGNLETQTILRRAIKRPIPLSFAQQRLWFINQLEPNSSAYNIATGMLVSGNLSLVALQRTFDAIIMRHEVLRTGFHIVGDQPAQVISATLSLPIEVIDLTGLPEAERDAKARCIANEEASRPFDLTTPPLLRARLLRLAGHEHVLVLTMHHIVFDAWSFGIFIREMSVLYDSFCRNNEPPLPELPIQYADFAVWQRGWMNGKVLETQLAYWKQKLLGAPARLKLPTDRARPVTSTLGGQYNTFHISKSLSESLKELSRQHEVTLFMTLLAAFQVLLHRYTEEDDILVGTPIANRKLVETESLIGFFINTLVLRTDLSGSPSFREVLRRVKNITLEAYDNQDIPFEKLVEELKLERNLNIPPLIQVLFVLQNVPVTSFKASDLKLTMFEVDSTSSKFDLTLTMSETARGLSGSLKYNSGLFDKEIIGRMVAHFELLLESIVANPDQSISDMPLMTQAEQHQLLVEWNNTQSSYQQNSCVHKLIEAQVERDPQAIAVVYGDTQLSYEELNKRANQLARSLRSLGVGPEKAIGIYVERSLEMMIGVLAILKAGGAYLPIDATFPPERLKFILKDAQAPLLLTQQHLESQLPELEAQVICLDAIRENVAKQSDENLDADISSRNIAYVIYTSGSTGKPKGMMIEHGTILNLLAAFYKLIYMRHEGKKLRISLNGPLAFDTSVKQIMQLMHGHTIDIIPQEVRLDAKAMLSYIEQHEINVFDCTPSYLMTLLAIGLLTRPAHALTDVLLGGEPIDNLTWDQLANHPRIYFYNLYGPTECTVCATVSLTRANPDRPSIGMPIANVRTYVLDHHIRPVPVGVPGELHIAGASVGRGYFNRPELTAEKFIPDPFSEAAGARMYKTGDTARYLADGRIEFIGRVDNQVKVRGYRIELGEIEAVLSSHPNVRECAVIVREDGGERQLVGYIVAGQEQMPAHKALKNYMKQHLPDYMVPATFINLEALPLMVNSKLDRRALPPPTEDVVEVDEDSSDDGNPIEEMLSNIFAEVLGINKVGVDDNFFELGGHSLLASQLLLQVQRAFQLELPMRSFFEKPTVAGLSESIEIARRADQGLQAPPIEPALRDGPLPLSFAQEWIWYLLENQRASTTVYNIPFALRLKGSLNVSALEQMLYEIIRRHEALRTKFQSIGGERKQIILPVESLKLIVVDLKELAEAEREAEAQSRADEEARQPFDLMQNPPLRMKLLRFADDDYVFLMTIHHIATDGWSDRVLVQEMSALYKAFIMSDPSPLPRQRIQYADYSLWQRQWLQGEVLNKLLSYWKRHLQYFPYVLNLPTDRPRPPVQSFRGNEYPVSVSSTLADGLRLICRQERVTMFMTLLASFSVLLYKHSKQDKLLVGTPIAARNPAEVEGIIGFFANNLIIPADLSGDPTFRELLVRVRDASLGAYVHQDLPFVILVETLQPEPDLSRTPLFQVMFVLQNIPANVGHKRQANTIEFPGVNLSSIKSSKGTANRDLGFVLTERPDGVIGSFQYNTDLFDVSTIERMAQEFQGLIEEIVSAPGQRLSEFSIFKNSA